MPPSIPGPRRECGYEGDEGKEGDGKDKYASCGFEDRSRSCENRSCAKFCGDRCSGEVWGRDVD